MRPRWRRTAIRFLPLVALALAVALLAAACGESQPGEVAIVVTSGPDDPKALGPVDAPVTVIEYADFQ